MTLQVLQDQSAAELPLAAARFRQEQICSTPHSKIKTTSAFTEPVWIEFA